eukprot:CAMPEP_0115570706 /NCGR_PEP_ID=MMETSP0271-20121206/105840_1 /TAXON_ID=71861 /ORGANISM="Scrippsiella trochoidea, Strain CCMP3099" /LENGTH=133 /DNA_ID=CAMNT_0003005257 /DNA_START=283 /DNA_END=680 /DNA_ORIENTATION=-
MTGSIASLAPASITVTWYPRRWQSGAESRCGFLRWGIEAAKAASPPDMVWEFQEECRFADHESPHCVIQDLESMTDYRIRVREICREDRRTSLYTVWNNTITTRPHFALAPRDFTCENFLVTEVALGIQVNAT